MTYTNRAAEEHGRRILELMAEKGVVKLTAYYSGGNDEGGVQDIEELVGPNGAELERLLWQDPLFVALDEFIGTRYGSWSGEFSASGRIHASVSDGRVWAEGTHTVDVSDDDLPSYGG